jgi:hypothetical protein
MAETIEKVKGNDLPQAESMASGDFFICVVNGSVKIFSFADLLQVFATSNTTPGGIPMNFEDEESGVTASVMGQGSEEGWEFSFADGVASITVPANSYLQNITVKAPAAAATYAAGNYVGALKIRIIQGGEPIVHNGEYANALLRRCFAYDANNSGDISPETPLFIDPGLSEHTVDELAAGIIGLVFDNIADNFTGGVAVGF